MPNALITPASTIQLTLMTTYWSGLVPVCSCLDRYRTDGAPPVVREKWPRLRCGVNGPRLPSSAGESFWRFGFFRLVVPRRALFPHLQQYVTFTQVARKVMYHLLHLRIHAGHSPGGRPIARRRRRNGRWRAIFTFLGLGMIAASAATWRSGLKPGATSCGLAMVAAATPVKCLNFWLLRCVTPLEWVSFFVFFSIARTNDGRAKVCHQQLQPAVRHSCAIAMVFTARFMGR